MTTQRKANIDFGALTVRLDAAETDVHELKVAIVNLDKKIDAQFKQLSDKIDARAATPWALIWAALGVMVTVMVIIGGLVVSPRDASISRIEARIALEAVERDRKDEMIFRQLDRNRSAVDYMRGFFAQTNPSFRP